MVTDFVCKVLVLYAPIKWVCAASMPTWFGFRSNDFLKRGMTGYIVELGLLGRRHFLRKSTQNAWINRLHHIFRFRSAGIGLKAVNSNGLILN